IGGKLVQHKAKRRGKVCRQDNVFALKAQAIRILRDVWLKLDSRQSRQIGSLPIRLNEQAVRRAQGEQPSPEALDEILRRGAAAQRLVCDRLHYRQRVLDPVRQLAEQQRLTFFPKLAVGDVSRAFHHQAAAVQGFELDPTLHDQRPPVLGLLSQFS